ncbi:MAG: hypothetical protein K6B44_06575 [Lachnospiraceae bacterium]|nr:hypothetical protein [Lachnospiraceae bacterium]
MSKEDIVEELFEDEEKREIFVHTDEDVDEKLAKTAEMKEAQKKELGEIRDRLAALRDALKNEADMYADVYEELLPAQQLKEGGSGEKVTLMNAELSDMAEDAEKLVDVISDMIIIRYSGLG